ncbi:hypothetical protein JRQ81_000446, partial [Phrynocephalus forsythii]
MRVSKDKSINHAGHLLANFSSSRSPLRLNGLADLNFDVPHCVPYAALCLEAGLSRLNTQAQLRQFKYWLRICFISHKDPLIEGILSDNFYSPGLKWFLQRIKALGISPDQLGAIPFMQAYRLLKLRLLDIERQDLFAAASKACSPLSLQLPLPVSKPASYLHLLENPQERRAFTLAR